MPFSPSSFKGAKTYQNTSPQSPGAQQKSPTSTTQTRWKSRQVGEPTEMLNEARKEEEARKEGRKEGRASGRKEGRGNGCVHDVRHDVRLRFFPRVSFPPGFLAGKGPSSRDPVLRESTGHFSVPAPGAPPHHQSAFRCLAAEPRANWDPTGTQLNPALRIHQEQVSRSGWDFKMYWS